MFPRIKAPERKARAVGIRARQQAKLGSILDQVHSDLIKEKSKGVPTWYSAYLRITICYSFPCYMLLQYCPLNAQISLLTYFLFTDSGQESPKSLRFLERVEKPMPRPPTPTVQCPEAGLEETEQAVVLLQRVLRGRAVQNKVL